MAVYLLDFGNAPTFFTTEKDFPLDPNTYQVAEKGPMIQGTNEYGDPYSGGYYVEITSAVPLPAEWAAYLAT